jgi:hypothetical protein
VATAAPSKHLIDADGNLVVNSAAVSSVSAPANTAHFDALPADSGVRLDAGGAGDDTRRCPHCDRDVPSANYAMHELRCARNAAYHKVPCSQCGMQLAKKDFAEHVHCKLCGTVIPPGPANVSIHEMVRVATFCDSADRPDCILRGWFPFEKVCPERTVKCECGASMKPHQLDAHKAADCPKTLFTCEYCEMKVKKPDFSCGTVEFDVGSDDYMLRCLCQDAPSHTEGPCGIATTSQLLSCTRLVPKGSVWFSSLQDQCGNRTTACEACNKLVVRKEMAHHLSFTCPVLCAELIAASQPKPPTLPAVSPVIADSGVDDPPTPRTAAAIAAAIADNLTADVSQPRLARPKPASPSAMLSTSTLMAISAAQRGESSSNLHEDPDIQKALLQVPELVDLALNVSSHVHPVVCGDSRLPMKGKRNKTWKLQMRLWLHCCQRWKTRMGCCPLRGLLYVGPQFLQQQAPEEAVCHQVEVVQPPQPDL